MNNYKNELNEKMGTAYTNAIIKMARQILNGKQEKPYEVDQNLALALVAVIADKNKGLVTVNFPATLDYSDLKTLDWRIGTNEIDNQLYLTY